MVKPISSMSNTELRLAVDEKKALPDMILKRHIFDAQKVMVEAHAMLMYNRSRNSNIPNENDIYNLKSSIINLFGLIGEMARENGYYNLNNQPMHKKSDFEYMQNLIYLKKLHSERDSEIKILIRLVQYNLNLLHRLNLTNLLIDQGEDDSRPEDY